VSDLRGAELLRAFRAGDTEAGLAWLNHAEREDDLVGTIIEWQEQGCGGGPSPMPKRKRVQRWGPYMGVECPGCDRIVEVGAEDGPVMRAWRGGERFPHCGAVVLPAYDRAHHFAPFICVEGETGPMELSEFLEWMGDDLTAIDTNAEQIQRTRDNQAEWEEARALRKANTEEHKARRAERAAKDRAGRAMDGQLAASLVLDEFIAAHNGPMWPKDVDRLRRLEAAHYDATERHRRAHDGWKEAHAAADKAAKALAELE